MDWYRCLDTINPTTDEILLWANDLDLFLTEQDEDLILLTNRYILILLQLACDVKCPKQDYCFSILKHHIQHLLGRREVESLSEAALIITKSSYKTNPAVRDWLEDFHWINALITTPRQLVLAEVQKVANFIMSTDDISLLPVITEITASGYIQYELVFETFTDFLYINPLTADWKHSHNLPIKI